MENIMKQAEEYKRISAIISRAHYIAWERATKRQSVLGVPVVVITAIVGSSIFATINSNPGIGWKITAGLISLLAAVLAALQTSFKYSELADHHKSAGASYAAMRRQLELFMLRYSGKNTEHQAALSALDKLVKDLDELAKKTPSIPDELYYSAVKQLQSEEGQALDPIISSNYQPQVSNK